MGVMAASVEFTALGVPRGNRQKNRDIPRLSTFFLSTN
ncbi:MAG: hypothetical protein ACJA09_000011 [Alcanivorax sp.]|jgi:hypothetical protein